MFLHIAGGEIAFPNFKDFMNSDGPFQLSYPDANLQPTKFAINDEARNFPKEAIEQLGEGQKAKEKADKILETIEGHCIYIRSVSFNSQFFLKVAIAQCNGHTLAGISTLALFVWWQCLYPSFRSTTQNQKLFLRRDLYFLPT